MPNMKRQGRSTGQRERAVADYAAVVALGTLAVAWVATIDGASPAVSDVVAATERWMGFIFP
jgi:hypothetical protein